MSARFVARRSSGKIKSGDVVDRKTGQEVAWCDTLSWAHLVADGLNLIVDQVTPWARDAAYAETLDGEVVEATRRAIEPD